MILFLKKEKKIHYIENNYYKNFRMNIYYIQKIINLWTLPLDILNTI
jgi:hypothetical protein